MSKKNEIQANDENSNRNEDNKVEFYPEISQQFDAIVKLISEVGKVTVEYFNTQAKMYYVQLNAFISNQEIKSDERTIILQEIKKINNEYMNSINNTDDINKRKALESIFDYNAKLYLNALAIDSKTSIPKSPNLLKKLKNLF